MAKFNQKIGAMLQEFAVDLQQFSNAESMCIEAKIPKLIDEGKPMKQAIAIAISTCAPGKAKNALKPLDIENSFNLSDDNDDRVEVKLDNRLPGGEYESRQNTDTSWDMYDLPIVANRPVPLMSGKTFDLTRSWLEAAKGKAQLKFYRDAYAPPIRIRHDRGTETRPSGKFILKDVRLGTFEGEEAWVLYADFIGIPNDVYQRIRRGELSYLSAEMINIEDEEINLIAMLPDEEPFFRWPMITVGLEKSLPEGAEIEIGQVVSLSKSSPMIASRAFASTGVCILSRFATINLNKEKQMALKDEKKKAAKLAGHTDEDNKDNKENKDNENDKDKKKSDLDNETEGLKIDAVAAMIAKAMSGINDALAPLMELADSLTKTDVEEEVEDAVDLAEEVEVKEGEALIDDEIPIALKKTGGTKMSKADIALSAKLAASEDRIKKLERTGELKDKISEAQVRLAKYGADESAVEENVRKVYEDHGAKGVDLWLDAYTSDRMEDPPDDMESHFGSTLDTDPELKEYQTQSPDTRERAIQLSREYDEAGGKRALTVDKATFVKDNLAADLRKARA